MSGDSRPMGAWHGDTAANHTDLLYLTSRRGWKNYIRRPDVLERIGSYLPPEFPLFHEYVAVVEAASTCVFFIRLSTKVYVHFLSSAGGQGARCSQDSPQCWLLPH